jgi:hypothetical protein
LACLVHPLAGFRRLNIERRADRIDAVSMVRDRVHFSDATFRRRRTGGLGHGVSGEDCAAEQGRADQLFHVFSAWFHRFALRHFSNGEFCLTQRADSGLLRAKIMARLPRVVRIPSSLRCAR